MLILMFILWSSMQQEMLASTDDEKSVAYLIDINGDIHLIRKEKKEKISSSCFQLINMDVLQLGKNSSAKIVYPEQIFKISGPGKFNINKPKVNIVKADSRVENIKPVLSSRGSGSFGIDDVLFTPPANIMKLVIASTNRTVDNMLIYSPKGKMFTLTPAIIIGGKKNSKYLVSILPLSEDDKYSSITMTGFKLLWKKAKWENLKNDAVYRIEIKKEGKILTDPEQVFFTLTNKEKNIIQRQIDIVEKLFDNRQSKIFAQANILYQNECYAEARILFQKLSILEPKNITYLKFIEHCYKKMGITVK